MPKDIDDLLNSSGHKETRFRLYAIKQEKEQSEGKDECINCGRMFNATPADKMPICKRCK